MLYTCVYIQYRCQNTPVQDETAMLRRALKESMGRLASLSDEGNVQVDRRIVVKLLVTFFEKGQSKEVLQLMARILNFTGQSPPSKPMHAINNNFAANSWTSVVVGFSALLQEVCKVVSLTKC